TGGKRHYACSQRCRKRILDGARAVRLGEFLDPLHSPQAEASAEAELLEKIDSNFNELIEISKNQHEVSPQRYSHGPPQAEPASRARVLSVFNHKGGTAKTTTAVSISAGLAKQGKRVLLVDTDSQGNVATSLHLKFER